SSGTAISSGITGNPTPTYQWERSTDGGETWTDVVGPMGSTYNLPAKLENQGDRFRATATNSHGSVTGPVTTLDVGVVPTVSSGTPSSYAVIGNTPISFSVTMSSLTPATIAWERSPGNNTWSAVPACDGLTTCAFTATLADDGWWF